jgi:hypothetical protein
MFGGGASGRPLGIFHQFGREVPGGLHLVGAAGFVAVLSEPMSSRLISFATLGVVPAPAGRCGRARTNYGRQMNTRSRITVARYDVGGVKMPGRVGSVMGADAKKSQRATSTRIQQTV